MFKMNRMTFLLIFCGVFAVIYARPTVVFVYDGGNVTLSQIPPDLRFILPIGNPQPGNIMTGAQVEKLEEYVDDSSGK